jgi:hypothetical protein
MVTSGLSPLDTPTVVRGLGRLLLGAPREVWAAHGWTLVPFVVLAAPVALMGYCALCRMVASDLATGVLRSWTQGLRFALNHWRSVLTAWFGPLAFAGLIALGLASAGFLLLRWPYVDLLGSLLFGLFLLAGAVAVVVLVCYALGRCLLIPAVACEGSDGIDAIQRAYAYVLGRPLRLVLFGAFLVVQGLIALSLAWLLASAIVGFTRWAASAWGGPHAFELFAAAGPPPLTGAGTPPAAARILAFWNAIPFVLVAGFGISYLASACTVLYLLLRRSNDGQDIGEIWVPGLIEGTMAETLAARAKATEAAAEGRPARLQRIDDAGDE